MILTGFKCHQLSRILLSILAGLSSAVIWTNSILLGIFSSLFSFSGSHVLFQLLRLLLVSMSPSCSIVSYLLFCFVLFWFGLVWFYFLILILFIFLVLLQAPGIHPVLRFPLFLLCGPLKLRKFHCQVLSFLLRSCLPTQIGNTFSSQYPKEFYVCQFFRTYSGMCILYHLSICLKFSSFHHSSWITLLMLQMLAFVIRLN